MHGWLVADEANTVSIVPTVSTDLSLHFTRQRSQHPVGDWYWLAPADYIGNKVEKLIIEFNFELAVYLSIIRSSMS